MNARITEDGRQDRGGLLWIACSLLCLAGFITGTVVFSRSFSDSDVTAYIRAQRLQPTVFFEGFICFLRREALFFAAALLLAFFAVGWLILPGVLIYRGLGIGIGACCLTDAYGWFGALYAVSVVAVPSAIALVAYTLVCKDAIMTSFDICRFFTGRDEKRNGFSGLMSVLPLGIAVAVFAAALSAWMRLLFRDIILT